MRIEFEGLSAIVEVPDNPAFLAALRGASPGWPFSQTARTGEPAATVREIAGGFALRSPWQEATFVEPSAVRAACSIVVDVVTSHIAEHPSRLCLHCGSAVVGGRLVVFPSRSHAGKSTLIARLAADGCQIYGDDVLPLDEADRSGIAMGLAPRLRLPLPASASPAFRRFVAANAGPSDGRYHYLSLPGDGLAARGVATPLGAIVLLDRRSSGPAHLGPARRADALKALISQNFARGAPAGELLARLHALMARLPGFTLAYSDLDEAAALIGETFATWPPRPDPARWRAGLVPAWGGETNERDGDPHEAAARPLPAIDPGRRWRRNPAVTLKTVDGETFLATPGDASILHLNAVGTGLWNLLAEGIDREEAVAVLHGAFPDADRTEIERDVTALLTTLAAADLIVPEEDAPKNC